MIDELETKQLAKAIAAELNELYLSVQGDDYRELVIQANINGVAIGELEKQLKHAKTMVERLIEAGNALYHAYWRALDGDEARDVAALCGWDEACVEWDSLGGK